MIVAEEFIQDYQELIKENAELKTKLNYLELKVALLEKAVEFLSDSLDEAYLELGFKANNQYLIKQILQK